MASSFTKPYVDALFDVAGSLEAVEALLPSLRALGETLAASAELRDVLYDPGVSRETKRGVLDAVAERVGAEPLASRLAGTLLLNRRLPRLAEVLAALRHRLDLERRLVEALVKSAAPLDAAQREALQKVLEARTQRKVRLAPAVDPSLLGGFVVQIGSEVWDASLSNRLEKARQALATVTGAAH